MAEITASRAWRVVAALHYAKRMKGTSFTDIKASGRPLMNLCASSLGVTETQDLSDDQLARILEQTMRSILPDPLLVEMDAAVKDENG